MSGERKPRPQHEIDVDRDLFAYCDALKAIEHHKTILIQAAFGDAKYFFRLTSTYGSQGGQHMASSASAEADARRIEKAEAIVQANRNYTDSILDDIADTFQGASDYKHITKFIELYWWTFPRETTVKIRKDVVIAHMPFLKDRRTKEGYIYKPFYDFREKIYIRLAEVWGYSAKDRSLPAAGQGLNYEREVVPSLARR